MPSVLLWTGNIHKEKSIIIVSAKLKIIIAATAMILNILQCYEKHCSHCAKCYISITSFIPFSKSMYKLHFTDEETKLQMCLESQSSWENSIASNTKKAEEGTPKSSQGSQGRKIFSNKETFTLSISRILASKVVRGKHIVFYTKEGIYIFQYTSRLKGSIACMLGHLNNRFTECHRMRLDK